ncbi:MAG TPA: hypothetical protein VJ845_00430, partial [Haploplasma sp.]|nr:hypothetical protein [Haploplasma sp.]
NLKEQAKIFVIDTKKAKLEVMYEMYLEYKNTTKVQFFHYLGNNPFFGKGSGKFSKFDIKPSYIYEDLAITQGLKLEGSTELTFSSEQNMHIYIQLANGNGVNINKTEYTPNADNVIELTLDAGDVSISRGKTEGRIIFINVTEGIN